MQSDRSGGRRFLWGFGAGLAASSVTLVVPLALLAAALSLLSAGARAGILVVLVLAFGAADLLDRTPHVWRQVPQRLVRVLPPGRLGFLWAYDLGLLVTTQKTTSLIWIGLAGLVLTQPVWQIAVGVVVLSGLFGIGVAVLTVHRAGAALTHPRLMPRIRSDWVRPARFGTALVAFAIAGYHAVGIAS